VRRLIPGIVIALTLQVSQAPSALGQVSTVNRGAPSSFGISGRIIVPVANFQDQFEVLLVQNLAQPVQATVADSQGRYRFSGIPRGTYYITVKIDGFQEVRQRVDLNSETIMNIILDFEEERVVKPATDFSGENVEVVDISDLSKTYPPAIIDKLKSANKDFENGNYLKAVPLLEEIIREAPDFYQAHRLLGVSYQKVGRYRDSESEYRTAAELKPTSAAPLINLGSLFVQEAEASAGQGSAVVRGILNEALASLNEAVKLKSDAPFAYYLLGVTYYRSAFYEDAEDNLKRSLDLAPELFDARLALANVYIKMQEWPNVITQLDAYLASNPKSAMRDLVLSMRAKVLARSQAHLR
jgi:tetratricopeptide (TPR) repeat protein